MSKKLCPWSYSTNYRESGRVPLDLMFQNVLPKLQLNFAQTNQSTLVINKLNKYFNINNKYSKFILNKNWTIKPSLKIDNDGVCALTCKHHENGDNKIYILSPKSLSRHILNSK